MSNWTCATCCARKERTEWVIVSTGMFTSFLFEPSFGVVNLAHNTVNALGSWDNAVTVTTPEDIGALTTEIVFAKPRIANRIVHIAGETLSYKRLADTVDAVLGRHVRRTAWSVPRLKDELAEEPGDAIRKYRVVFAEGKSVAWGCRATHSMRNGALKSLGSKAGYGRTFDRRRRVSSL